MGSALTLSACGGDSDSSGTPSYNGSNPDKPSATQLYNAATSNACVINATTNEVYATNAGCNFAHPTLQNGTALKYTCVANGRVNGSQGGLNITAKKINLSINNQSVTVLCKS